MKRINKLYLAFFSSLLYGLLGFSGCTLVRESFNEIYPDNFYQNANDVERAVTSLYSPFSTDWTLIYSAEHVGYIAGTEFTTDILDTPWTRFEPYQNHSWDPNTYSYPIRMTQLYYEKYNHLTRIIDTIKKIKESPIAEEQKAAFIAEAKCIYGWLGFILYDLFGPVPLATEKELVDPSELIMIPRLSDEEYTTIMCNYLKEASLILPERAREWGRVTKGFAKMLLLKFYMIDHKYDEAEIVAREIVEMEKSGIYGLIDDYSKVFEKSNARNKEIIMAIPCGQKQPNYWLSEVLPNDYPYPSNVEKWNGYHMRWQFYDTFEKGDDRLKTIIAEYINNSGEKVDRNSSTLQQGAIPLKIGIDPDAKGDKGTTDQIVYRYADVLLSLAECINMNNGSPAEEAIDLVNTIRSRVSLPKLKSTQTISKEAFNDAILMERAHELYCEGSRRQDLIRMGKYTEVSKSCYPDSQSNEYKNRFPIPIYYIHESKGVVKQNPGY